MLNDTPMDNLNRIATDYLECPKCDSENLKLCASEYFVDQQSEKEYWHCKDCQHDFIHYT